MDNTTPTATVRAELDRLGPLPAMEARMADGIVTLSGSVSDEALRRRIEQRLLALPDVLDVHNYLKVVPPCDDLEGRLRADLAQEGVACDYLRIHIEAGVVTLSGRAESWFDRDAMGRLAWTLPGVREVVSRVGLTAAAVSEPDRNAGGRSIA